MRRRLLIQTLYFLSLTVLIPLITGCPPSGEALSSTLLKATSNGCQGCSAQEGEGESEGEGEMLAEGEISEGESEGETLVEGESTEGEPEGELSAEGEPVEGEMPGEGELPNIILPGEVSLEMVWIEGGAFQMGAYEDEQNAADNEMPQHPVNVPGFWLGKREVTKAQWRAVMGAESEPWSGETYVLDDSDSPAVYVSWNAVQEFITALNLYTDQTFRLPSEAEWEYACRAGTATRFYWGDDLDYENIGEYAWWNGNTVGNDEYYAHATGVKTQNDWGLFDMSGNVWEWCEDDWHVDYTNAPTDGSAWIDSTRSGYRVLRGGGWENNHYFCRSAVRTGFGLNEINGDMGFRVCK